MSGQHALASRRISTEDMDVDSRGSLGFDSLSLLLDAMH